MRSNKDITLADLLRDDAPATISVPQAARLLGICRNSGYKGAAKGEIPTVRVGRPIRVPVPQFLAMLVDGPTVGEDSTQVQGGGWLDAAAEAAGEVGDRSAV